MRHLFWSLILAFAFATSPALAEPKRIVTLGGDVTEIVFALGEGAAIAGTDTTSVHPAETHAIPKLGYVRSLGAEGIVSLKPDLVIASADAGPDAVLDKVAATGIALLRLEKAFDEDGIIKKINAISDVLEKSEEGVALIRSVRAEMAALSKKPQAPAPSVLFILSMNGQAVMAAGRETAADAAITLAGGTNLFAAFEGYKSVSPEALFATPPDAIVIMGNTVARMGGLDPVVTHAALQASPAVKNDQVIVVDGMALLGFGPRTPAAIATLRAELFEQ